MQKNIGRARKSQRNFSASILSKFVTMFTSFASRTVFVKTLGAEYLGLGGLFGNIFSVISLCELGLGAAIAQSLYKPLAENDKDAVSAITAFYAKCTRTVACVSIFLSLLAYPFLGKLVKSTLDMGEIRAAFVMFSLHTFVSYLLLPKRTLVVCDQRMYVVSIIRCVFSVFALGVQVSALVLSKSYLVYLAARIIVIALEDITVNAYADRAYPFLALVRRTDENYRRGIFQNTKALLWHKLGGTLSRSTDSLLLSYFVGLSGMGKYSNYALVIGTIGAFFDVAINAVSASVGNLGAGDRGKKSEWVMKKMYFLNFWMLTVGTSVVVSTLNPIIELWLGEDMLFTNAEMLVIVSSFYFSCIRDPVQIFVSTYGLFKESKHLPVFRALSNLVLSIAFVQKMGVAGVFLGTTLSTVLVPLCGEVIVLYKYGFSLDPKSFLKQMLGYIAVSFVCIPLCFLLTYGIRVTFSGVIIRVLSSLCASNAMLLVLCSGNECFDEVAGMLKNMLKRRDRSKF